MVTPVRLDKGLWDAVALEAPRWRECEVQAERGSSVGRLIPVRI